jgi:hypothetical protein
VLRRRRSFASVCVALGRRLVEANGSTGAGAVRELGWRFDLDLAADVRELVAEAKLLAFGAWEPTHDRRSCNHHSCAEYA